MYTQHIQCTCTCMMMGKWLVVRALRSSWQKCGQPHKAAPFFIRVWWKQKLSCINQHMASCLLFLSSLVFLCEVSPLVRSGVPYLKGSVCMSCAVWRQSQIQSPILPGLAPYPGVNALYNIPKMQQHSCKTPLRLGIMLSSLNLVCFCSVGAACCLNLNDVT